MGSLRKEERFEAANGSQLSGTLLRKKPKLGLPKLRDTYVLFYQGTDRLIRQLVLSNKFEPPRWIQNDTFRFNVDAAEGSPISVHNIGHSYGLRLYYERSTDNWLVPYAATDCISNAYGISGE
jgi:hypothetical protein